MDFMEILENNLQNIKTYDDSEKYGLTVKPFSSNPIWTFNDYLMFILSNKGKSLTLENWKFCWKLFQWWWK